MTSNTLDPPTDPAVDPSAPDDTTIPIVPTRPSAGYALTATVRGTEAVLDHMLAAVSGMGAAVRTVETLTDRSRRYVIACAGIDQQLAVRTAIECVAGLEVRSIARCSATRGRVSRRSPATPGRRRACTPWRDRGVPRAARSTPP